MNRLWIKILLAMLSFSAVANAQGNISEADSIAADQALRDSIKTEMMQPDYIIASLLVATPGFEVYSESGHAALRLRCPSKGIDHTFEFASLVNFSSTLEFINGSMDGGFVRLYTEEYIDRYRTEGRGVGEVPLNLTPEQKLSLWAFVDKLCDKLGGWKFDYMVYDCSNMVQWAVESNLLGEKIEYHDVDPRVLGTYRDTFAVVQPYSPWSALFWDIMMGTFGDESADFKENLYPNFLYEEWQKASLVDSLGNERPLMLGNAVTLVEATIENKPLPITPLMVLWTLFVLTLIATIAQWKWGYGCFQRIVDVVLFTIQTLIGLWVSYLIVFSHQVATDWNWLIVAFNPVAIVLWLVFRKKAAMRWIYAVFTVVLVAYALSTPWNPQLMYSHLYIFVAAMAARTAFLTHKKAQ